MTALDLTRRLVSGPRTRPRAVEVRLWAEPGRVAIVTWLAFLPAALLLPGFLDESPFGASSAVFVLALGIVAVGVILALSIQGRGRAVAGVAAGGFGAWCALAMRAGLEGSPYPFFAGGDTVRLMAMADRFTTTIHSADGIVAAVPTDYPPLLPWVVGRMSVLSGVPAWQLLGPAEIVLASGVVVAGFLLWRRIVSDWVAFALAAAVFADFLMPAKAYEWMALELVIPWALASFDVAHVHRPLSWPVAGILGGLQILLYQGDLMFLAPGILAIAAEAWRRSRDRVGYLGRLAGITGVSLLVAAPYLAPYVGWSLAQGLEMTDRYRDPMLTATPWEIFAIGPLGVITLIGIVGVVWRRTFDWWPRPLLWLLAGAYLYRLVGQIEYDRTGQTLVFQYTIHVITATLIVAGILTLTTGAPRLLARRLLGSVSVGATALVLLVAWIGVTGWSQWIPAATRLLGFRIPALPDTGSAPAASFTTPLPDGRFPRFAPQHGRQAWFPTDPIRADVASVLGRRATPLALSASEQLYAFVPWPGFLGVGANAAASTSEWFSRLRALQRLSRVAAPARFADASADTPYGAIDVFVLHAQGDRWEWTPLHYPANVVFHPAQFSAARFVVDRLPGGFVLAIRRRSTPRPRPDGGLRQRALNPGG